MQHEQDVLLVSVKNDQYVVCLELSSFLVLQNDYSLSESFGKIS